MGYASVLMRHDLERVLRVTPWEQTMNEIKTDPSHQRYEEEV